MANKSTIRDKIQSLIPSTSNNNLFGMTVLDHSIDAALLWHSQFKPRRGLQLETGSGTTHYFNLNSDVIHVRLVEIPFGETPPYYVNAANWHIHQGTSSSQLVIENAPDNGDIFGIHYSGEWSLSDVDSGKEITIAYLSCAVLCLREAARMASNVNPLIDADTIDYRDHSVSWRALSKQFMSMYASSYGLSVKTIESGAPPPAFAVGQVPSHTRYKRFWWVT